MKYCQDNGWLPTPKDDVKVERYRSPDLDVYNKIAAINSIRGKQDNIFILKKKKT